MTKISLSFLKKTLGRIPFIFLFSLAVAPYSAVALDLKKAQELFDAEHYEASLEELMQSDFSDSGEALELLARLYSTDEIGVDPEKIEQYLWLAVQKDFIPAIVGLGILYENGDLLAKNPAKANELFLQASELGDAEAALFFSP